LPRSRVGATFRQAGAMERVVCAMFPRVPGGGVWRPPTCAVELAEAQMQAW